MKQLRRRSGGAQVGMEVSASAGMLHSHSHVGIFCSLAALGAGFARAMEDTPSERLLCGAAAGFLLSGALNGLAGEDGGARPRVPR